MGAHMITNTNSQMAPEMNSESQVPEASAGENINETTETTDICSAGTSTGFSVPDVEPWGDAVEGGRLLDDLATLLRRHVVLPHMAAEALALWIVHTYAFELRDVTAYVGVESPLKRCGK